MIRWLFVGTLFLMPALARAQPLTVGGKSYNDSIGLGDKTLRRIGAGVREKLVFNVYVMAAYSESGQCDAATIVNADEVKYLRLDLLRDVPAREMASAIDTSFAVHMPRNASAELVNERQAFESEFKGQYAAGTVLEFTYVPGTGTSMKQNGKLLGPPLAGAAFMHVLWDIYFGDATCCAALKAQIAHACK